MGDRQPDAAKVRRLIWSPAARDDLIDIQTYIAEFNPAVARRLFIKLVPVGQSLLDFPDRGRPIGRGRREITLTRPYILRYVVVGDDVDILSVRHAARRPPE